MNVTADKPLVSIICVCYNQAKFVEEALASMLSQTYKPIEFIVTDDASTDNSLEVIQDFNKRNGEKIQVISNSQNQGHCKVFNQAFQISKGEFIIDLAADDVLEPNRVSIGVEELLKKGPDYGIHYSDATLLNEHSEKIGYHRTSEFVKSGEVSEGDVYASILQRYFICPPSMMYTRQAVLELDGYDESLYYEDFDFWVRSSRVFKYCFTPELLVKKRILKTSKSAKQYTLRSKMLRSTLKVCEKAFSLNKSKSEFEALQVRINYELRNALLSGNLLVVWGYVRLSVKNIKMIRNFTNNQVQLMV